jgi:light-regulated signal transduction histidine kinase (bacteriophytochrome)
MPLDSSETASPDVGLREAQSRIEALQRELVQAQETAEQAQRLTKLAQNELQAFVYAASHDLKESLRSVSSHTQLMLRNAAAGENFTEFGPYITEGIKTAVAFLDRMNAFSRIELSPKTATVSLSALVQMAILRQQHFIRETGAQVTWRDLPSANVNEGQFTALIDHLLDNALRYRGSEPPRIEIWAEETDEGLIFAVGDNGPGIKPEYFDLVFQPFKRLHGKSESGVGLGLAVATKIAIAHQGRIWVESDGNSGSSFKVFFPF